MNAQVVAAVLRPFAPPPPAVKGFVAIDVADDGMVSVRAADVARYADLISALQIECKAVVTLKMMSEAMQLLDDELSLSPVETERARKQWCREQSWYLLELWRHAKRLSRRAKGSKSTAVQTLKGNFGSSGSSNSSSPNSKSDSEGIIELMVVPDGIPDYPMIAESNESE